MKIILKLSETNEIEQVQNFFWEYIKEWNSWIVSNEFLCPFWIKWAIKRKQIIILKYENNILGALRFYHRKTDNIVSVYQFALYESITWKWLIKKMLEKTWYKSFETTCFLNSGFNNYYMKTGWKLVKKDNIYNYWLMNL